MYNKTNPSRCKFLKHQVGVIALMTCSPETIQCLDCDFLFSIKKTSVLHCASY